MTRQLWHDAPGQELRACLQQISLSESHRLFKHTVVNHAKKSTLQLQQVVISLILLSSHTEKAAISSHVGQDRSPKIEKSSTMPSDLLIGMAPTAFTEDQLRCNKPAVS